MQTELQNPKPSSDGQLAEDHGDCSDSSAQYSNCEKILHPTQRSKGVSLSGGNLSNSRSIPEELSTIEDRLKVRRTMRHGKIEAFQDWTGVVAGTVIGMILVSSGTLELLYPDFLPLATHQPSHLIGAGILLTGSRFIISRIHNGLLLYAQINKKQENEDSN